MEYEISVAERDEVPTAVVRAEVPVPNIGEFLGGAFGEVMGAISAVGVFPAGPPFARYDFVQVPTGDAPEAFLVEAGFPVSAPVAPSGRVEPGTLPGGPAAVTVHVGPYQNVAAAYSAIEGWLGEQSMVATGAPWESYLDDPAEVPEPHTEVVWPCGPA